MTLQDWVRSGLDEEVKVQARSEAGSVEGRKVGGETDKKGVWWLRGWVGAEQKCKVARATHPSSVIKVILPGNVLLKDHFPVHSAEAWGTDHLCFTLNSQEP